MTAFRPGCVKTRARQNSEETDSLFPDFGGKRSKIERKLNRVSGSEIKSLLFGKEIKGFWFWEDIERPWRQVRTVDGIVEHFGWPIHPDVHGGDTGVGRIEDDMLCEQWANLPKDLEICVVLYRVLERNARIRWGEYVMVTETGPQSFKLAE